MIILIIILAFPLLYLFLSFVLAKFFAVLILKPPEKFRPDYQKTKEVSTDGMDWEDFDHWEREDFPVRNGDVLINGDLYPVPNPKGVVICAHGFGQNKLQMAPHAALYRELGFSTILYDQRCWGESKAPYCSFGWYEADDLVKIVKAVRDRYGKDTKVVVTGVSMGAVTVMNAISRTDLIDAAVDDCGFARIKEGCRFLYKNFIPLPNSFLIPVLFHDAHALGIPMEKNNPVDSVARSNTPLLVIHGDADRAVNVQDAYEISKVAKNPHSRLVIFPGKDHGYCLSDRVRYREAVEDFLKVLEDKP